MSRRQSLVIAAAVCLLLLYFSTRTVLMAFGLEGWATRGPRWDAASHAIDGIHFARAFRHLSPGAFFIQLHNSAMWPPVIPLLQAPFQLLFGESWLISREWTAWSALPAILAVFVTGYFAHKRLGLVVGAIAASLLAISPYFQEFMLLEMFEVPGILFCFVTLGFYAAFLATANTRLWTATCFAGIVLFFCKFNYAVLIMLPIVICEFSYRPDFRTLVISALKRFIRDVNWRGGFVAFVIIYSLFLIYVQKVGIRFEWLGQRILIERALGNPLYLLVAILLIRNFIVNRVLVKEYARNIWNAPEPVRSLLRFDILPALIWLSYPVFFSIFLLFMFNESTRSSSFWSMETLSFYPGAFINLYAAHPILGGICLASFAGMILAWKLLPRTSRFFVGLTLLNVALTVMHPNYQIRYLMTAVPMIFMVTGLAFVHLWESIFQRAGERWDKVLLLFAPGLTLGLLLSFPPNRVALQQALIEVSQHPNVIEAFQVICRESLKSEKNTLVGFSNNMSPPSIGLQCFEDFPEMRREQLPVTMGRLGFGGEISGAKIVKSGRIDRFFEMDYSQLGIGIGKLQEVYLLDEIREALPHAAYDAHEILNQGAGGYRIVMWSRRPEAGVSGSH